MLRLFNLHSSRHPFSRSYGVILPSSLTIVLPLIFGFSPCLPVSVCGTGTFLLDRGFSWQCGLSYFTTWFRSHSYLRIIEETVLPVSSPYLLRRTIPSVRMLTLLCHPFSQTLKGGTGISTGYPSPTPFGLGLGPDLPWVDEPSSGILRLSMGEILTPLSLLMPTFSLVYNP